MEELLIAYQISSWPSQLYLCKIYTQMSSKMAIVEYQISLGKETLCSKDRHPLLLKCFITSLRCIRMVVRASYQIYNPLMVNTLSFFTRTTLNFQPAKLPILGTRILILSLWNMPPYCKDKHPLLIESILASIRCIRICRRSLDSISDSLMVFIALFIPNIRSNFKQNAQL